MGHIEITRRWVEDRRLILTAEDLKKHDERLMRNNGTFPAILGWHRRFTKRLEKCPYCGKAPRLLSGWRPEYGFDYKYVCDEGDLHCGDWYSQLSRAGLDWNYRVRETQGEWHRHVPHHKVYCDAYGRKRQ